MVSPELQIGQLRPEHDNSAFACGTEALDAYLQRQASQDVHRRVASCFVATTPDNRVIGYYTLASTSLLLSGLPISTQKKLPRYPLVPAVRMGRLAIDHTHKGRGLGAALLADSLERTIASEIASFAIVVDGKDDTAARFYLHHGFIPLPETPLCLFLPLAGVRVLA